MNEIVAFNQTKADVAKYKAENAKLVFPYDTAKGLKDARSHVHKLRKARASFERLRVSTKADALKECKDIDAAAKEYTKEFDEMIDLQYAPIKVIEEREEAEKQAALDKIREDREKEEAARLADLEAKEKELEELKAKALATENAIKAKEAAAKAEIERIAREKQIAEDAKIEAEQKAQRDLKAAEEKRVADIGKANRHAREVAEAKEQAARKAKDAELAEKARLDKIEADRIADVEHREKVEGDMHFQINIYVEDFDTTSKILIAIKDGAIPNLQIHY